MKHRQTVRDGVILYLGLYLGAQVFRIGTATIATPAVPIRVKLLQPRISAGRCVPWGVPADDLDLDEQGVLNTIGSIMNSTSSS
jgi:hypothetical protein